MKDLDRQIFYGRCDKEGLTGRSCALRAIVELDDGLATKKALARPEDRDKVRPDMLNLFREHPGAESAFSSSSSAGAASRFICNLCDQSLRVVPNSKQDDSALEIQATFPLQCNAYLDVRSADLTARIDAQQREPAEQ